VTIDIQSHGEDTSIREVSFRQILDTKVEDGVFYVERHCGEGFEIRAVGLVKGRLIAGKTNGEIVKRGPLAFDEKGLACYDSEFCGKSVNEYDRLSDETESKDSRRAEETGRKNALNRKACAPLGRHTGKAGNIGN
jgi:hypothetical protein